MMTAWRLLPGCQAARPVREDLCGHGCEAVYSCIGNCIAAQQQSISFTCTVPDAQQQPSRLTGKLRWP